MAKRKKKYTKPKLREEIKEELMESDKGGRPGQWSARKSQMLVQEYERQGGGYEQPKEQRDEAARSLERWTEEEWQTKEGEAKARQGNETKRYLPKEAWEQLPEEEKEATDKRKRKASRRGKQYVANTRAAKKARRKASRAVDTKSMTKKQLYEEAQRLDIHGRSKMNKRQLARAVSQAT